MIDVSSNDKTSNGCNGEKIQIAGFGQGKARLYSCSITTPDPNETDLAMSLIDGEWYVVATYTTDQMDMMEDIRVSCQKGATTIMTDMGTA